MGSTQCHADRLPIQFLQHRSHDPADCRRVVTAGGRAEFELQPPAVAREPVDEVPRVTAGVGPLRRDAHRHREFVVEQFGDGRFPIPVDGAADDHLVVREPVDTTDSVEPAVRNRREQRVSLGIDRGRWGMPAVEGAAVGLVAECHPATGPVDPRREFDGEFGSARFDGTAVAGTEQDVVVCPVVEEEFDKVSGVGHLDRLGSEQAAVHGSAVGVHGLMRSGRWAFQRKRPTVGVDSLEAELDRARALSVTELADAIESIGFECTRCGACCKAETCGSDGDGDDHTATVFPDEVRAIQRTEAYDWRDVARPMPYGVSESGGETFEWALETDACGDCVFYEDDSGEGGGACTIYGDRPLVCESYPFSVDLAGTSQPLGEAVDEAGMVRAHECEGLGRDISRAEAEDLAATLKERTVRELEEAISVRDNFEPADPADGDIVVHDSEGAKAPDGTPR